MAIINQARDRSIAERHFQMGPCPPVLLFITVSTYGWGMCGTPLALIWHMTLTGTSILKRALMQNGISSTTQDACSLRTRSRICTKIHNEYVLTFTGLSIRAQTVASTTAARSGLVAATQKADMGTSTRLSIWNYFTCVTPDCGHNQKGQRNHYKPIKHPPSVFTQTPVTRWGWLWHTHLHMLTYL